MLLIGMTGDYLHEPGPGSNPRTVQRAGDTAAVLFEMRMQIPRGIADTLLSDCWAAGLTREADVMELHNKQGCVVSEYAELGLCYAVCRHDTIYFLVKLLVLKAEG